MKLDEYVGKEIFMFIDKSTKRASLNIYYTYEEVLLAFASKAAMNVCDAVLYHGVLTKACSVPSEEISSNIDILVVIPGFGNSCETISCFSLEYAEKLVPALLGFKIDTEDPDHYGLQEDIKGIKKQQLEDLFIFYGYSVELHYTFQRADLDEEIIEGSKEIYASISANQ